MAELSGGGVRRRRRKSSSGGCTLTEMSDFFDPCLDFEEEDDDEMAQASLDDVFTGPRSSNSSDRLSIPMPRMNTYSLSLANLEDSQDTELDAIIGELCALENQFDQDVMHRCHARSVSTVIQSCMTSDGCKFSLSSPSGQGNSPQESLPLAMTLGPKRFFSHRRSNSGGAKPKMELIGADFDCDDPSHKMEYTLRTDSPDNDSAFSDSVSMLSSESSASSGARTDTGISSQGSSKTNSIVLVPSPTQLLDNISKRLQALQFEVEKENSPPAEQAARIKAEKIRIALEKIKEASVKKIYIKAFTADNSAKSLLVNERMTVGEVCRLLADKNHVPMDPRWTLIEHIPELFMERTYEDHECVVENLLLWVQDSPNKLLFLEKDEKYDLFINPEDYLLLGSSSEKGTDLDDDAKANLIDEFFSTSAVPEVEGALYLKSDGKKAWKKQYFVLRASGIYYCPKGKSKLSKDLICLTTFEMNYVYVGFGWKKKYKAPTDFCFAVKHPQIQTKSSKYIKYLCAEDEKTLKQWVTGIRIAKFGSALKLNYDNLMREIVEEDLETLAHARSFSVSSMAKTLAVSSDSSGSSGSPERQDISLEDVVFSGPQTCLTPEPADPDILSNRSSESTPTPTPMEWNNPQCLMIRHDSVKSSSSSSSGCLSERSGVSTPTAEQMPFEPETSSNTLKRKPSLTPKIPLTNTTRNIAKQSEEPVYGIDHKNKLIHGNISSGTNALPRNVSRRFSLRRSQTDDHIMINGMRRNSLKRSIIDMIPLYARRNSGRLEDFPLPPPPMSASSSIESLDIALLPPPPPEAFRGSTTSLDSLPPPPPPIGITEEYNWPSTTSLNSLPPPPSPQKTADHERNNHVSCPNSSSHITPTSHSKHMSNGQQMFDADAQPSPLPFLAELKLGVNSLSRGFNKSLQRPKLITEHSPFQHINEDPKLSGPLLPLHHLKGNRRASAPAVPMTLDVKPHVLNITATPPPPPPPPPPPLQIKNSVALPIRKNTQERPPPPVRNGNTNDSSLMRRTQVPAVQPGQSIAPIPCPQGTFLRDLQRVMMKKWKVAQQLSVESTSSPSEILGFRDPSYLPPQSHTLGHPPPPPPPPPPHHQTILPRTSLQSKNQRLSFEDAATPKKRLPPPPPRRSESTQLSTN